MAEKDLSEKILLSYNDVFADVVNGLLFKGESRIKPDNLTDKLVHSQYKADDGNLHEEERDVLKLWKDCGIEIALCGLENQSVPYRMMPARVIGYDGASYRNQLLNSKEKVLTPVVTLVLYFGYNHWRQPKSLKELFGTYPEELDKYINDYRIHVFEIAWLTDEEISRFSSDFRIVAKFFAMMRRTNGKYIPDDPQEIKHVDELLKLLSVMTGDNSYTGISTKLSGRRYISMGDFAQNLIMKGKAEGIAEGAAHMLFSLAHDKIIPISVAAERSGMTVDDFVKKMQEAGFSVPE